jgi:4-hydroxy-3-methylbut-2-enyl diphosphate reductase
MGEEATRSRRLGLPGDPLALLARVRADGERLLLPGLELRLARAYGFCQGVRRAVARALEAASAPAGRSRLFVTGEIIHNPAINEQLREAGVVRLPPPGTPGRLGQVGPADRVIIPAFGIDIAEAAELEAIGCEVIDTTCGWVRRVWQAAAEFAGAGLTLVIHGKAEHEETRATASRIHGPWVIVRSIAEAGALATAVREPRSAAPASLPAAARGTASDGFDPARDLQRLGLVNQTTMLESETQAIAHLLREALAARWGAIPGPDRFRVLETFCTATQKRQDAVRELLAAGDLQRLIVIGGFRSSNTAHLARLGSARIPTYHVEDADCLLDAHRIRHRPTGGAPAVTRDWLPAPPRCIGITAGASTPEQEIGRLLQRIIALHHATAGDAARREGAGNA